VRFFRGQGLAYGKGREMWTVTIGAQFGERSIMDGVCHVYKDTQSVCSIYAGPCRTNKFLRSMRGFSLTNNAK